MAEPRVVPTEVERIIAGAFAHAGMPSTARARAAVASLADAGYLIVKAAVDSLTLAGELELIAMQLDFDGVIAQAGEEMGTDA